MIVVVKEEPKDNLLKREDSNLSQKSLTKLKAAISKDPSKKNTAPSRAKGEVKAKPDPQPKLKAVAKVLPTGILKPSAHSTRLIKHVENIDARDAKNPILVSEHVNEIYEYLRQLEKDQPIEANFLEGQQVRRFSFVVNFLINFLKHRYRPECGLFLSTGSMKSIYSST